jgi:hypothetical protein
MEVAEEVAESLLGRGVQILLGARGLLRFFAV